MRFPLSCARPTPRSGGIAVVVSVLASLLAACGSDADSDSADDVPRGPMATFAGTGEQGVSPAGTLASQTLFNFPADLTFGPDGLPYVLDFNNHRVIRFDREERLEVIAGTGELGHGPEGLAVASLLVHPSNVAFDGQGRMIIAAWHNNMIKRVDLRTGLLTDICGNGRREFSGDGGHARLAALDLPSSIVLDDSGNLYISDQHNQRIRMVDRENLMRTVAGTGATGYSGDGGPAIDATFNNANGPTTPPAGRLAIDRAGNLYLADTGNHVVRRIDAATGFITTIAGTGTPGFSGDGGDAASAQLNFPTDLWVESDGSFYVADTRNHCIRRVDRGGIIQTVAGVCGRPGFSGDGGSPSEALLYHPLGLARASNGDLYIADFRNHRIRVVHR